MLKGFVFLLNYSWKFSKSYVFSIFLLQIVISVIPLAGVIIPKFIIDELLGEQRVECLVIWIGLLLLCNFGGGILVAFLRGYTFSSKGVVFSKFQTMIAEKLSKCDFEQLENPEFLNVKEQAKKFLYANGQGFGVVLDSAVNILGKMFVFAGLVAILSTMNIWIVLLFIGLVLINTYMEGKVRKNYVKWDMEKAPIERKTGYFIGLVEDFSYGKEVRLYNLKDWIVDKVSSHLNLSDNFYKKQVEGANKISYFNAFTTLLRDGCAYVYITYQVLTKTIGVGDYTMYLAAVSQFSNAMNDVMQSILNIKQFGQYYEALEKYMNVPAKMREGKKLPVKKGLHTIEFKNVSFRYNGMDAYVLKNINITLLPGEKLSIVGENGAGKTTFVKLLCRFYDPTDGQVLMDGIDIRDYDYDAYMSALSAVFQDYKLFSFTVKENVTLNQSENIPDDEVEHILKKSGFGDKLDRLDKGIHSNIYKNFEPDGFEPSGGEGQKLSLARALFKDAGVVILDEPTAALDPRAEYELYQKFGEMVQGKTAVFISHRLSSSRFCDKVAVFHNGEIIEYGTHEELVSKDGTYSELFHMQSEYYIESCGNQ